MCSAASDTIGLWQLGLRAAGSRKRPMVCLLCILRQRVVIPILSTSIAAPLTMVGGAVLETSGYMSECGADAVMARSKSLRTRFLTATLQATAWEMGKCGFGIR